jgi:SAM-dependent methyltransferase
MSVGFNKKLIEALLCQKDNSPIEIENIESGDDNVIFSGSLKCSSCNQSYQIKNGILNFLSSQADLPDVMKDEIEARNKEAGIYDERLSVRYHKEVPSTLKTIGDLEGKKVIEYGCGTGRLTKYLADECGLILANDFSLESLFILGQKLAGKKNVGLILADSVQLKTREKYFDIACSFQFLEHVPTSGQRANFINNTYDTLTNDGISVSTVYHFDLRRQKNKQSIEGMHNSGIFFHYFTSPEIETEFKKYFAKVDLRPIDITLPMEARLKLSVKLAGALSRFFENIPYINKLGHLLIIKAKKE